MLPSIKQTLLNVSCIWSHKIISIFTSFLITGLSARYFGFEQMGIWLIAVNAASYVQLFDFGAASALPRILPSFRIQRRTNDINSLIKSTYLLSMIVAIFGSVLVVVSFVLVNFGFFSIKDTTNQTNIIYLLAFFLAFMGIPYRSGTGLLAAVHRFDLYFGIDLVSLISKLIFVFSVVYIFKCGFIVYSVGMLAFPFLVSLVQFKIGLRLNDISLVDGNFSKKSIFLILSHCWPSLLITFSSMLLIQGSTLLAGSSGIVMAAVYGYSFQLVLNVMSFSASIGGILAPVASALHGAKNKIYMEKIVLRAIKISSSISVILALLLICLGPMLIRLWVGGSKVGEESLQTMNSIVAVLSIGSVFITPSNVLKSIFLGTGKQWQASFLELVGSGFGLFLGWLLMTYSKLGVSGVSYGIVVSYLLRGIILFPIYAAVGMNISSLSKLISCLVIPCLVGFVSWFMPTIFIINALPAFKYTMFVEALCESVLWIFLTYIFVLDRDLKIILRSILGKFLDRIAVFR